MSKATAPVRFGLVGAGIHGARYAKHIVHDVAEARLVALTRRDAQAGAAQAAELGVEYVPDLGALLQRDDIDAVAIVTPPSHHFEACSQALAAGKHVLVEKPMTADLAEAVALRPLVRAAAGRFMLAQTLRYDGVLTTIRRRLGEVGRVRHVRLAQRLPPSSLEWQRAHRAAGAGSILLTGVHVFDTVCWLLNDRVREIYCVSRRIHNPYNEDFFAASALLESSDVQADLEISKYTQSRSCRIEVVGDDAQFLGDYWNHKLFFEAGREQHEIDAGPPVFTVEASVRAFCRALLDEAPMPIGVDDGIRTLEIVDACYASVESHGPVVCADAVHG